MLSDSDGRSLVDNLDGKGYRKQKRPVPVKRTIAGLAAARRFVACGSVACGAYGLPSVGGPFPLVKPNRASSVEPASQLNHLNQLISVWVRSETNRPLREGARGPDRMALRLGSGVGKR
jgi:hypothetical protein